MGRITLVTGGGRSGKSTYAQSLAESLPGRRAFVATCPVIDDEMDERIAKHKALRQGWETIEEPVHLAEALSTPGYGVFLVDCLTLWVNNLLYADESISEEKIAELCRGVLDACRRSEAETIFVTNEVGMGIVPGDPLSRRYRDLIGRANQVIAQEAESVVLVVCGISMKIKE
ncbi:MAG: bifunctional adenosylcobinamide kinase/adenosylcobinamide-phosphate guanylyltransferase [Armatimonadota bacterium]